MSSAVARRPRSIAELTARDIMEEHVVTVAPSAPLAELERLLTEHRISGMPVTDASGRAIGVVSWRDLLDHAAKGRDAGRNCDPAYFCRPAVRSSGDEIEPLPVTGESAATVADVMTPALVDVSTEASIEEICRTMARHAVHRVLVTEPGTGRMVGILSSLGVLAAIAGERTAG